MIETIISIILAIGIGSFHETNKPTKYELNMEDGSQTQVILKKNSHYACPLYCEVDHAHHAVIYKSNNNIVHKEFIYHIFQENANSTAIYCSVKKILSISKLPSKTGKEKLPDAVNASTEK